MTGKRQGATMKRQVKRLLMVVLSVTVLYMLYLYLAFPTSTPHRQAMSTGPGDPISWSEVNSVLETERQGRSGNVNSGNVNSGNVNSGNVNSGNVNSGNVNSALSGLQFPASPAELFRTHDVQGESSELVAELYERSRRVDEMCRKRPKSGKVMGLFTHDPSRVAYCFLPKVGCTFWIRVFSFLHNFTGDAVTSPWEIPRLKLHSNSHSHGVAWESVRERAKKYLRFMFVRHPFSRLWSAYVDKLFLPDFWSEIGVPAVRKIRGHNSNKQAQKCGNDVTFPEFVTYSLTVYEPHWHPIYLRCDPCQYKPTVVGSMKNFSRDSLFLLRRMDMEWVLKDLDRLDQEEKELSTLIDYNFERVRTRSFYRQCINDTKLASLLWTAFQFNGYIPKDTAYQLPYSGTISVEQFKSRVLETFRTSLPRKRELSEQKRVFLRNALDSLSPDLMQKVKQKYQQDMLYFGFDEENY